jgi:hypothetical protein
MALTLRIALGLCIVTAAQWAVAASPAVPSTAPSAAPPEIPLLEPGLWIFEIETRREGKPVEKRKFQDCVDLRGLYSAERPTDCKRIDAIRSPDGTQLVVEMACAVPPRLVEVKRPTEDRGRGPLDYAEPGLAISSRSVFTGDLRRNYVRDNITTVESPPGERQTTRSVTRGVWQSATCPAHLPPDDPRRWIRMPVPAAAPMADPVFDKPHGGLATRPVMRTGLWSSKLVTRTDKGKPVIEETQHCVPSMLDRGGVSIPTLDGGDRCGGEWTVDVVQTPEGFGMSLRCEAQSAHHMVADLDFERITPAIVSRSEFKGDLASRFRVDHRTEVVHPSNRKSVVVSNNDFIRIGDCTPSAETVP